MQVGGNGPCEARSLGWEKVESRTQGEHVAFGSEGLNCLSDGKRDYCLGLWAFVWCWGGVSMKTPDRISKYFQIFKVLSFLFF